MEIKLPALLSAPAIDQPKPLWLTNARLFDGTSAPVRDGVGVLIEDGRIVRVGSAGDGAPEGAVTVDLGGRTLMPGMINAHLHAIGQEPQPGFGAQPLFPAMATHMLAAHLREFLRYGVTTVRDMGTYHDQVYENRQAMRYGAFRGARILTCGLIISSTAPGTAIFDGMYREADGADEVRKAVREQVAKGADLIKLMTTGARSVELEAGLHMDTCGAAHGQPNQLTPEEMAVAVEEATRLGYRVTAHAEGIPGCETAIELGMNTVEHGFYLNRRPDLLEAMAAKDIAIVPTFSSQYVFAGRDLQVGLDGETEPYMTPELEILA
ncbi:MAG: amidohydrolase family protein, partial [Micromonosporaceae bacterium]